MKRVIIATICLLLVSTISSGQKRVRKDEWTLVELLGNNEAIYIQNKKKVARRGTIKVWTKIEQFLNLTGIEKVGEGSIKAPSKSPPPTYEEDLEWESNKLISKSLYEFNCKEEMLRVNYVIWYKGGKAIATEQRKRQWTDVIPESIGESLFQVACKNKTT